MTRARLGAIEARAGADHQSDRCKVRAAAKAHAFGVWRAHRSPWLVPGACRTALLGLRGRQRGNRESGAAPSRGGHRGSANLTTGTAGVAPYSTRSRVSSRRRRHATTGAAENKGKGGEEKNGSPAWLKELSRRRRLRIERLNVDPEYRCCPSTIRRSRRANTRAQEKRRKTEAK